MQTYVDGCCKTCKYSDGVVASYGLWWLLNAGWTMEVAVVGLWFWLLVSLCGSTESCCPEGNKAPSQSSLSLSLSFYFHFLLHLQIFFSYIAFRFFLR